MSILFGHPTGNPNSHHAALAHLERGQLAAFVVPWMPSPAALRALRSIPGLGRMESRLRRRNFPPLRGAPLIQGRAGEFRRLALRAAGKGHEGLNYEANDWLMETMARASERTDVRAVHAYEDCALLSFEAAKRRGKACIYDMPIGYHPAWRETEEKLKRSRPDWIPSGTDGARSWVRPDQKIAEMALADLVLVPGSFAKGTIERFLRKKIAIAPYGVDADFWAPATAPRPPGPLRFLYAGQMAVRKGIPDLIEAWQDAALGDARLDLVGLWNLAPEKRRTLPPGVHHHPPCAAAELRVHYHASDVFVFPSHFEGFGLVLLEAMACGLPAIASSASAGADVIDPACGRVIEPGSRDQLVEALRWFASNRAALPVMGAAARGAPRSAPGGIIGNASGQPPHPTPIAPPPAMIEKSPGPGSLEVLRQNRRLTFLVMGALVAALVHYSLNADVRDPLHLYQGFIILALAAWPTLQWTRSVEKPFPAFEVFSLTSITLYALPILNGHTALANYPAEVITRAGWCVILFQASLIATHAAVGGGPGRGSFWTESIFPEKAMRYLSYGTVISSAYAVISTFYYDLIPSEIMSVLRAVCFGVGTVCTFIAARLWGMGGLSGAEKAFLTLNLAVQVVAQITTLYLIGGISVLLLFIIGYVIGSRRVPILLLAAVLVVLAVLHNGKSAMRAIYWEEGARRTPDLAGLPAFFEQWGRFGLDSRGADEEQADLAGNLLDRTSLFHILCLVVDSSPERLPYLEGETYGFVLPQFVPRFFWAGKPLGHAGTYRLAIYYGLQTERSVQSTTIGFGLLPEAYANLGLIGVVLLGVVQGAFFKKVRLWTRNSPMISYGGIFLVLLMAWSFQNEFTAAAWISSFYQACVTVLGLPFILRSLFR